VKRLVCLAFVLLLTACVPIGVKWSNLPYASVNVAR
jgi:hypothetical protein